MKLAVLFIFSVSIAVAGTKKDLELKNGLYLRNFAKFTCSAFTDDPILEPSYDFKKIDAKVGDLLVDRKLNNALIKVKFNSNGTTCSFSAISKRSRETVTLELTQSKVFAINGSDNDCIEGKITLDNAFKKVGYEASSGRHEFVALLVKTEETEKTCAVSSGILRLVYDKNRDRE